MEIQTQLSQFAVDTISGLSKKQKTLMSKYFYDAKGDAIFQQIMAMPEYYLTRCEMEVFETQKEEIFRNICPMGLPFNLIELGAGDGSKTIVLLKHFLKKGIDFTYYPVDISQNILDELVGMLLKEVPELNVVPLNMDYFEALKQMEQFTGRKNITMFLGSNIGNFDSDSLEGFLTKLQSHFKPNDKLLLGVDLKKDPHVILDAYNDKPGITASFNMNLLKRMNRELGADFDLNTFKHYALYEPITGEARSYIVSLTNQTIQFNELDFEVAFEALTCDLASFYCLFDRTTGFVSVGAVGEFAAIGQKLSEIEPHFALVHEIGSFHFAKARSVGYKRVVTERVESNGCGGMAPTAKFLAHFIGFKFDPKKAREDRAFADTAGTCQNGDLPFDVTFYAFNAIILFCTYRIHFITGVSVDIQPLLKLFFFFKKIDLVKDDHRLDAKVGVDRQEVV